MSNENQINIPINLPSDLLEKYREVDKQFMGGLLYSDPKKSFLLWNDIYQEVLRKQPIGKRYHKGGELHNKGICKLFLLSPIESLDLFILAFIEDTLSTKTESGILPEEAPAAQNLKNFFKLTESQFKLIKTFIKEESDKGVVQNPEVVLSKLDKNGVKSQMERSARKFAPAIKSNTEEISKIPGEWDDRVFIGGDCINYFYVINMLKILVKKKFTPIIAKEFKIPDGMSIRHHALLLLHNCKYAIFDISGRGGHLMEIERTFDYQTEAHYICLEGQRPTAMLDWLKEEIIYIKNIDDDLPAKINNILSKFITSTAS